MCSDNFQGVFNTSVSYTLLEPWTFLKWRMNTHNTIYIFYKYLFIFLQLTFILILCVNLKSLHFRVKPVGERVNMAKSMRESGEIYVNSMER